MITMKALSFLSAIAIISLTQCTPALPDADQASYLSGYDTKIKNDGSYRKKGYWDGDSLSGRPQIAISIDEQLAFFYKGSKLAGIAP